MRNSAARPIAHSSDQQRAALYLRVSTTRQAEGEVSLPSQQFACHADCERNNRMIVAEFVEARTATDDKRPVFQDLIERACDPDHPFDVIVCHAFSRFYRDGAEFELLVRKLRKHGVEVISVTQPIGPDPASQLMRQWLCHGNHARAAGIADPAGLSRGGRTLPSMRRRRSELAQRTAGDEVALEVEGVVNCGMEGEETLR
jgi:hypothetical protein